MMVQDSRRQYKVLIVCDRDRVDVLLALFEQSVQLLGGDQAPSQPGDQRTGGYGPYCEQAAALDLRLPHSNSRREPARRPGLHVTRLRQAPAGAGRANEPVLSSTTGGMVDATRPRCGNAGWLVNAGIVVAGGRLGALAVSGEVVPDPLQPLPVVLS